MSPNAPGSNEPQPALPTPAAPPPQEFDLLAFWIMYRRLIVRLVIAILLGLGVWGAWLFMEYRKRAGSEEAFGNAKNAADFRKVADDWSGTPAAGTALIRLAEELRKEGKPADAAQALRDFLAKYPLHPLRVPVAYELAASLETAGKLDEALAAYQEFAAAHGRSSFAPLAYVGQARVLTALGKNEEARKVLESIEQKFVGNPLMEEANTLLDEIKNPAARKTGGTPRPTPSPPPPAPAPPPAPTFNLQGKMPSPPPGAPAPAISLTPAPMPPANTAPAPIAPLSPAPPPTLPAPAPEKSVPAQPAPSSAPPSPPAPVQPTPPSQPPRSPAPDAGGAAPK